MTDFTQLKGFYLRPWEADRAHDGRATSILRMIPFDRRIGDPSRHDLDYLSGFYTTTADGKSYDLCEWSLEDLVNQCRLKAGQSYRVKESYAPRFDASGRRFDRNRRYVKYRGDYLGDESYKSPRDPMDFHLWPDRWIPGARMKAWATRTVLEVESVKVVQRDGRDEALYSRRGILPGSPRLLFLCQFGPAYPEAFYWEIRYTARRFDA